MLEPFMRETQSRAPKRSFRPPRQRRFANHLARRLRERAPSTKLHEGGVGSISLARNCTAASHGTSLPPHRRVSKSLRPSLLPHLSRQQTKRKRKNQNLPQRPFSRKPKENHPSSPMFLISQISKLNPSSSPHPPPKTLHQSILSPPPLSLSASRTAPLLSPRHILAAPNPTSTR